MVDFTNPLAALYGGLYSSPYDFTYLHYPIKFDDIAQQGHYMNFYINIHNNSSYLPGGGESYSPPQTASIFGIKALGSWSISSTFNPVTSAQDLTAGLTGNMGSSSFGGGGVNTRINKAISLYIPDRMDFGAGIGWEGDTSLTAIGGDFLKYAQYSKILGGAGKSLYDAYKNHMDPTNAFKTVAGQNEAFIRAISQQMIKPLGANDFLLREGGFAVNPQLLVLFKGIGFRNFQFNFVFTPCNETEATSVTNIIKMFRLNAHPEVDLNGAGRFYIAPSTFDIEFFYKGKTNPNVQKISTCVLTSYNVDYAPSGWSTHTDGMPVQTLLTLNFMETEIITRDKVNSGY